MALAAVDEPIAYKESMESAEQEDWKCAMKEDLDPTEEKTTWKWAKFLSGQGAIPWKMIFKRDLDEHSHISCYEARLVPKGYIQEHFMDYDKSLVPVVPFHVLLLLVGKCVAVGSPIHHTDISRALKMVT